MSDQAPIGTGLEHYEFVFDAWLLPYDEANPSSDPTFITKDVAYEWVKLSLLTLLQSIPVGKGKLMRVRFRGYQHEAAGRKDTPPSKEEG